MCGHHGDPLTGPAPDLSILGPVGRPRRQLHRRAFLGYFGKGTAALAILGPVAACSSSSSVSSTATTVVPSTTGAGPTSTASAAGSDDETAAGTWGRVNLGFVSAYVLARNGELAVVDTGQSGSVEAIGQTISDLGYNFGDVKHVALTHHHPDHVGSIAALREAAQNAVTYAGVLDLEQISADDIVGVDDGDEIMGMQVIHTPGHTEGHICLLDELTGTLVAGDAMNGADGGVAGANPRFTPDMDRAGESIEKLAQLQFDTVFFGHGEPLIGGASAAVADLASRL